MDEYKIGVGVVTRADKKLQTWRTIRATALRLFEEQGYGETTIDQIIAAAGVSRGTFFNYFASKEAVVFDPDPADRDRWCAVMREHTGDAPWSALSAIMLDFVELLRDRMVLQRRLKQANPSTLQFANAFGDLFRSDLDAWAHERQAATGGGGIDMALYVNIAYACAFTAYEAWRDDEPFEDFLERFARCLEMAQPQAARISTAV